METWDGILNDVEGQHIGAAQVDEAFRAATRGPVTEGNVGGGTGMICHGFKGGIGTSSRVLEAQLGGYTVGVLVQTNHRHRERLTIDGVAVGEHFPVSRIPIPASAGQMWGGTGNRQRVDRRGNDDGRGRCSGARDSARRTDRRDATARWDCRHLSAGAQRWFPRQSDLVRRLRRRRNTTSNDTAATAARSPRTLFMRRG
jgi:Peptidase family S58